MDELRDEFLSEEDLDLQNLSREELEAYWDLWFRQAQTTNHLDYNRYSHGVFVGTTDPAAVPPGGAQPEGVQPGGAQPGDAEPGGAQPERAGPGGADRD